MVGDRLGLISSNEINCTSPDSTFGKLINKSVEGDKRNRIRRLESQRKQTNKPVKTKTQSESRGMFQYGQKLCKPFCKLVVSGNMINLDPLGLEQSIRQMAC